MPREAAFFDLDRTLISGSSGPAVGAGGDQGRADQPPADGAVGGRRRCASACAAPPTRRPRSCSARSRQVFQGTSARQIARMAPEVLVGVLPRIYPEMLDEVYAHQDAGRPDLHRLAPPATSSSSCSPGSSTWTAASGPAYEVGEDGLFTGELGGTFMYGEGKVEAMRRFAAEHDIDLARVLRLLRLRLGPADAARGRQPRGRQPRRGADRGSPATEGWRVMRFERLGRRLALAGAQRRAARRRAPRTA